MAALLASTPPAISFQCARLIARTSPGVLKRALSTLPNNPHIYVHDQQPKPNQSLLSYLSTTPPLTSLAIGTTTQIPPTPESFTENHDFLRLLHLVIKENAAHDPEVQAQAGMYASQAGSSLGSGGVFFPHQQHQRQRRGGDRDRSTRQYGGGGGTGGDGAGGASAQGGMGGAGRGGYIHVSDQRNPPDFGRVAWPEDIFGSLELDGQGRFVDGDGRYQESGTYRVVTNEGILGLSAYLRMKLVERLQEIGCADEDYEVLEEPACRRTSLFLEIKGLCYGFASTPKIRQIRHIWLLASQLCPCKRRRQQIRIRHRQIRRTLRHFRVTVTLLIICLSLGVRYLLVLVKASPYSSRL